MSKKSSFTTVTPLPAGMTRAAAVAFLQDHQAMIDLNPLVTDRQRIPPPAHAQPDELPCAWYQVTDRISYLPGGLASGSVRYSCAFLDLAGVGLQTHCYAPMGVDLRTRWSVGGSAPGEERERPELGVDVPATGLYLREDTELRCSLVMAGFVRKTLKDSHKRLVARLAARGAREVREREQRERVLGVRTTTGGGGVAEKGERGHGCQEKESDKSHRLSSYYMQREAEAGRRSAAAAGGAAASEYPRNAANRQSCVNSRYEHASSDDDRRTSAHSGNAFVYQQHQQVPQYYEAGVSHVATELP
ncbi:hypothetical protein PWT90_11003 [Aphanocladium album]|nr:hypothetical protein PWT90_11003 [Aphanocladium album]